MRIKEKVEMSKVNLDQFQPNQINLIKLKRQ
jgi:hypothetical protein